MYGGLEHSTCFLALVKSSPSSPASRERERTGARKWCDTRLQLRERTWREKAPGTAGGFAKGVGFGIPGDEGEQGWMRWPTRDGADQCVCGKYSRRGWNRHGGTTASYTWPFLGPGQENPDHENPDPSSVGLTIGLYKSDPSPAQDQKARYTRPVRSARVFGKPEPDPS